MIRMVKEWFWVYVYGGGILFFCVIPIGETSLGGLGWDKIIHFFIYFIFALLVIRAATSKKRTFSGPFVFILLFFFGLLIEGIQYFLPFRSFEVFDLVFNSGGVLGALLAHKLYVRSWCKM